MVCPYTAHIRLPAARPPRIAGPIRGALFNKDPGATRQRLISCEANPRRVAKVTKLIEREIGSLMLTDKVLTDVTRTKSTTNDIRGAVCSCTGVDVTSDLQVVKVYVSVFTTDEEIRQRTLRRLGGLSGYVRRQVGERVSLRLTPEIRFIHDVAVERGERVLSLLERIKEGPSESDQNQEVSETTSLSSDDTEGANPFWEGVGDPSYDSDNDEESPVSFFSADMFPDASPADEKLAAARKKQEWKMRKGSPRLRAGRKKIYRR